MVRVRNIAAFGDFATPSPNGWAYAHRCGTVLAPATRLANWPRLDLMKIDAEEGEALV